MGRVLLDRRKDTLVLSEIGLDLLVGAEAQRTDERGHRDLSVLIDAHVEHVVDVVLVFEPCAAVRNDSGGEELFACFVVLHLIIDARRTNKLGNDDALGAVDHERAGGGHQGEIAHEDFGLLDFSRFLIEEARGHTEGRGIRGVAFLTLGNRVIGLFVELVVHKVQHEIPVEIRDAGHIVEYLLEALLEEPVVGILLDLDQVRHLENLVDVSEAHARVFAKLYRLNIHH